MKTARSEEVEIELGGGAGTRSQKSEERIYSAILLQKPNCMLISSILS